MNKRAQARAKRERVARAQAKQRLHDSELVGAPRMGAAHGDYVSVHNKNVLREQHKTKTPRAVWPAHEYVADWKPTERRHKTPKGSPWKLHVDTQRLDYRKYIW